MYSIHIEGETVKRTKVGKCDISEWEYKYGNCNRFWRQEVLEVKLVNGRLVNGDLDMRFLGN